MLKDKTVSMLLEELGSKSPTPGGGAAAAISGALAASLVEMVCNLTIGKEKYTSSQKEMQAILTKTVKYKSELLKLADEDVAAFSQVMQAYRVKDNTQIKKALNGAIAVPLRVALLTKEIQKLALVVARKGNKNAYSDAKTALHLAKAAVASALENVKINRQALAGLD